MPWETAILTSAGGRDQNQDEAMQSQSDGCSCWILCDGLGAQGGGERAARTVASAVTEWFRQHGECSAAAARTYLEAGRKALLAERANNPYLAQMNTTAVLLLACGNRALWAHAGDSRLYWFRGGRIVCRTRDHSVPQTLFDAGKIAERDIRFHEDRNKLLKTVGSSDALEAAIEERPVEVQSGDAFLLASDGFWELVLDVEMEAELARASTARGWLEGMEIRLRQRTFSGHDNYTAIAVWKRDGEPPHPEPPARAARPLSLSTSSAIDLPKTERPMPRSGGAKDKP